MFGNALRRAGLASVAAIVLSAGIAGTSFAQTSVPPGAPPPAAPVPVLPIAPAPPPNTVTPGPLGGLVIASVVFPFFGPSADVVELDPVLITIPTGVGIFSGPDATTTESSQSVSFGTKPAGSQFIAFFVRGNRIYVFDLSTGNYAWITATNVTLR